MSTVMPGRIDRRSWLLGCGSGLSLVLAGCLDDDNGNDGEDDASADDGTTDPTIADSLESYAYDIESTITYEDGQVETVTMSGEFAADGNYVLHISGSDLDEAGELSTYVIDGTSYTVMDGVCFTMDIDVPTYSPFAGFEAWDDFSAALGELEADDTSEIDGEEVYVYHFDHTDIGDLDFDFDGDDFGVGDDGDFDFGDQDFDFGDQDLDFGDQDLDFDDHDLDDIEDEVGEWSTTVYISASTGLPIRTEYEFGDPGGSTTEVVSDLHSFGEEFTIEPPAEC